QPYFQRDLGRWAVSPFAFKPHPKRDVDGMSFFREDFSSPQRIAAANRHPHGVRVAKVVVSQLQGMGLDAQPAPDPGQLPGHVIVIGMRFIEKSLETTETRRKTKERSLKLAEFATKNGLYCPPGLPDPLASPKSIVAC